MPLEIELKTRQTVEYLVRELSQFDRNDALKQGFREAAAIYVREARQNMLTSVGYKTDNLWGSLTYRLRNMKSGIPAVVGFRRSDGPHAHLLDLGTDERYTKSGARRGRVKPTYFFTRAREEGEQDAKEALIKGVQRAIERINSRR